MFLSVDIWLKKLTKRQTPLKWVVLITVVIGLLLAGFGYLFFSYTGQKVDSSTKLVTFYDGDTEKTILTKAKTVGQAIADANLVIGQNDIINPSVNKKLDNSMVVVSIKRARPIIIVDDNGARSRIVTAEVDKTVIAKQAGMELTPYDQISMSIDQDTLSSGGVGVKMTIHRAKIVNLLFYGKMLKLHTNQSTVKDFLAEAGIKLAKNDTITTPLDGRIINGSKIEIWRSGFQSLEQEAEIPFDVEIVEDNTKKVGFKEIKRIGQKGTKLVVYRVNMKGTVELERQKVSEVITRPAVTQIEVHGTKVELPPGSHADWMAMAGISESDFGYANYIIEHESGWRHNAFNPSGAYGLPQALPGSKMASAGSDWHDNPITQLRWFKGYCERRYGSIKAAYDYWRSKGSY